MYANRPPAKDGQVKVPDAPGFGIELDWGMVKKYRID
jgi:D-arabinonate dehydratase